MIDGDFKGIFIPVEIVENQELSPLEKMFFSYILEKKECEKGNKFLAELFNVSKARIVQMTNKLKAKKMIKIDYAKDGKMIDYKTITALKNVNYMAMRETDSVDTEKTQKTAESTENASTKREVVNVLITPVNVLTTPVSILTTPVNVLTTPNEHTENKGDAKIFNKKEAKKRLLFELTEGDFETKKEKEYFKITLAFYQLFKSNLDDLDISTKRILQTDETNIRHIRLMLENKECTKQDLQIVFKYLKNNEFWKKNILSSQKLRKNFEQLILKAKTNENNKQKGRVSQSELYELSKVIANQFPNS